MTSATSAPLATKLVRRRAFTLVELLVVIGIIVLLIGILLPMVVKAMRRGQQARIASDLNAIAGALEVYKQAFGDYPRITYSAATTFNGTGSGAELLGKALLGLGNQPADITKSPDLYSAAVTYYDGQVVYDGTAQWAAITTTTGNAPAAGSVFWAPITTPINTDGTGGGFDGANGPGFRPRAGGFGQTYGPYLQVDKFKTRGLAIVDSFDNPILYYAANPSHPVVTIDATKSPLNGAFGSASVPGGSPSNSYVGSAPGVTPGSASSPTMPCQSLYNYADNDTVLLNAADGNANGLIPAFPDLSVMQAMLGDYNHNGFIDNGETAATTASFLLWSAGPDGLYGPVPANSVGNFTSLSPSDVKNLVIKCDDVTNFTFAP